MKLPRALRPLKLEYIAVAKVIQDDSYLDMTEKQFIRAVMKASGGSMHPQKAKNIWMELMNDAGFSSTEYFDT